MAKFIVICYTLIEKLTKIKNFYLFANLNNLSVFHLLIVIIICSCFAKKIFSKYKRDGNMSECGLSK